VLVGELLDLSEELTVGITAALRVVEILERVRHTGKELARLILVLEESVQRATSIIAP
jgi:hypothetical protein